MPRLRLFVTLLCCVLISRAEPADESDTLYQGWVELGRLNPAPAHKHFEQATTREARLGAALALLGTQPRTDSRINQARSLFAELRSENPDDDTGIAAAYQLARIDQLYVQPADTAAAIEAYRSLLARHPGNPLAERAAPKLALLLLYAEISDEEWGQHVDEITTLLPALQSPQAQRDTRLVLADALLRLRNDHARALPLLEYCLQRNLIIRPPGIANALLTAAECSRVVGRKAEAAAYYRRYVREFPREPSVSEASRRAEELAKEARP